MTQAKQKVVPDQVKRGKYFLPAPERKSLLEPFFRHRMNTAPMMVSVFSDDVSTSSCAQPDDQWFNVVEPATSAMVVMLHHVQPDVNSKEEYYMFCVLNKNKWALPGGNIDLGDKSVADAAVREWNEEVLCDGFKFDKARHVDFKPIELHVPRRESPWYPTSPYVFARASSGFFEKTKLAVGTRCQFEIDKVQQPIRLAAGKPRRHVSNRTCPLSTCHHLLCSFSAATSHLMDTCT